MNSRATAAPVGASNGAPNPSQKPNILYIMADQLAAPLLKMYNEKSQILTPNLDKLAAKSVQFDSAYTPSPLCAPSRMSMITGQLPMKIKAFDNASQIGSDIPTYAHYLRREGYQTVLAGKMHFVGDQLHGYETRLTSDIYPGDFGWVVNWDQPDTRLEWYHNASSILQAGPCVRSNQLDYDEEVMYRSTQFMYDHVREGPDARPFALTVSLTHPHDPYTIEEKYWDLYEGVDIDLPQVTIPKDQQDPHSKRLLKVCDLWDVDFDEDQIKRARRAYYGAVSYVDDCIGRLLETLRRCKLDDNTIIVFSGDHGDMLGERGLWYKMNFFEGSARVPLLISYPKLFTPRRVSQNVSTLDILPTMCDFVNTKPHPSLPMDGLSLLPHLEGREGHDTVIGEYTGEGTISPLMMIRRGDWKYITCPSDGSILFNLALDPLELNDYAKILTKKATLSAPLRPEEEEAQRIFAAFEAEAAERWDFDAITKEVLQSQRQRKFVWAALRQGHFTSWDYNPLDDGREKYIRSHIPLDDLERRARYPAVDTWGRETGGWVAGDLTPDEFRSLESLRQRLATLTANLKSLQDNVARSNPLPSPSSLQASARIAQHNLHSLQLLLSDKQDLFSRLAVHPSTNFPGREHEMILQTFLRKRLEPDVEGDALADLWGDVRDALMRRVRGFVEEESQDVYTAEERELGVENVRTGLRRDLEEEDEESDEEEEDGEGGEGATQGRGKDEGEDEDVVMLGPGGVEVPKQKKVPEKTKVEEKKGPAAEPEHALWFGVRADPGVPNNLRAAAGGVAAAAGMKGLPLRR
ncbi:choline sulfatase [Coniochaeta sp. 2T2.1]|nr:choline sulfatase [Coniochaeta sp. 2T2.1]